MHWIACVVIGAAACGRLAFDPHGGDAAPAPVNRVFVTSTRHPASGLGGREGGDEVCAARAAAAGLDGTFVAYLSNVGAPAFERLDRARGWVRVDGRPVADLPSAIREGSRKLHPILTDEHGALIRYDGDGSPELDYIATGTQANGEASWATCGDYTASGSVATGSAHHVSGSFSYRINQDCDTAWRYYCFQIDHAEPLVITPAHGRTAFVSVTPFTPGAGRGAADAICQADADANNIEGTFLALLPLRDEPGAARFDADGPRWVRLDGIELAPNARDFLDARAMAPLNVNARGEQIGGDVRTGVDYRPSEANTANRQFCEDWTSSAGTASVGSPDAVGIAAFHRILAVDCSLPAALYCLEP